MIQLHIRKGLLGESGCESFAVAAAPGLTPRKVVALWRQHLPQSVEVEVAVNGQQLRDPELDVPMRDGDDVMLLPSTGAGLDLLALVIYAVIAAAVSAGISYLMQSLSPRPKPPGVPAERGDSSSATYAWDGIQTNFGQGFPVPWVYGRHAVGGQVIYTDVFATTIGGVLDDRLKLVLALSEGPIQAIGDVVASDIDNLGGLVGTQPGLAIPDHIRVNNNLLPKNATAEPVLNVLLTNVWAPPAPTGSGDLLEVWNGGTQVGLLQIVAIRNAQKTDIDTVLISGACVPGNQLRYWNGSGTGTATVQTVASVVRVNTSPGARVWIRPGSLEQTPLPSNPFRGTSVTFSPSNQLNEVNDEAVFTLTSNEELSTVGFVISMPGGCYSLDPQGNTAPYPVRFDFYWRFVGTTTWRGFYNVGTFTQVTTRIVGSTPRLGPLLDSWGADFVQPGTPGINGPVEVRMVRRTPSGGTGSVSQAVWRNVFFNTAHVLRYPRVALLGLELSAGARFSGGLPNLHVRVDGIKVRVWDATNGFSPRCWEIPAAPFNFMTQPPGRNPAWVLLDFLTSPWGLGKWVRDADLDLPSFRRWAAFCDSDPSPSDPWGEAAFQVDLVGDAPRPAWEWVLAICAAGRASPVVRNGKIGVVYQYRDAHSDGGVSVPAKTTTQLITSGNCERVQVTWLPKSNRPTAYLVQFLNADQLYAQDVLPVEDAEGTLNDPAAMRKDEWRPETLQAYGVTRPSQCFREGVWRHRVQRLIRRELAFVTGRWALAAEVGDLIDFESESLRPFGADVPLNMSIRVGGTGVFEVTLDHTLAGTETQIVLRDRDGKPQRRTITAIVNDPLSGEDRIVQFAGAVDVDPGAPCVVGLVDKTVETYEIVSISLQKDLKREVRAVQWVPEVHDEITEDMFVLGVGEDVDAGDEAREQLLDQPEQEGEPTIETVRVIPQRDGTHLIAFAKPINRKNSLARVYMRDADLGLWVLIAETAAESVTFAHFVPGRSYVVAVCLEGVHGQHALPEEGAQVLFVAEEFPPFAPPPITNARAVALDDFLLLQWDDLDVRDLTYYEVRIGTDWASAPVVHRARAARALLGNPPGGGAALIAARSSSGLYGNPVRLTLPTWTPRNTKSVLAVNDFATSPAGTHSGTQWNATLGCIELVAGGVSGTYTSAEQDVGYQAPVYWQVRVDRAELELTPVAELVHLVGSGEALWRTVNGRPASPAAPGTDWQDTVAAGTLTLEDLARHPERLVHGHAGEVGTHTRVLVESRFEVSGVWSAWTEHADRTVVARKMQVRLTLSRMSAVRHDVRATALRYDAFL